NAIETYLELDTNEALKYKDRVQRSPRKKEVLEMEMTWADRLRETGRREGVAIGRQEGVAIGRQEGAEAGLETCQRLLLRLIGRRFGPPSSAVEARVRRLHDLDEIETLSAKVMDAKTLAELGLDAEDAGDPGDAGADDARRDLPLDPRRDR
ncbi:MAG: DUF4351 domain-containing protein, partial [Acidobacteriota bacterium]